MARCAPPWLNEPPELASPAAPSHSAPMLNLSPGPSLGSLLLHGLALFGLLSSPALAAPPQASELDQARSKYGLAPERECTEATEICVRLNNVEAVELMLSVLRMWENRGGNFLPQAHYRDVVWGGLVRITDPYARRRVAVELAESKSEWVRQWCVEVLGEYKDANFGEPANKALRDREVGVQRAAARACGKMKFEGAQKALVGLVGDKDEILRANAVEALCRIDPAAHRAALVKALKDKDGGVRCALLAAAAECYPGEHEAWSTAALADADWRPRMQAVDNLGGVRTKTAVDALVRALGDGRPAVAARAIARLQELTREKHRSKATWEAWWRDNRETFTFPEGAAPAGGDDGPRTVAYHGVQVNSDHTAFLIDKSEAMNGALKSASSSKAVAAQKELEAVLEKLEGQLTYNVFTYAENVNVFEEKGPVELTAKSRKRALEFVEKAPRGRSKDIWKLLEQVISDPDLDTAFLLSSGEPDIGTYVHWNRVTWHLRELNRFHKVVVHTIVYSDSDWYRQQLEKISEVTGGEHRAFD